MLHLPIFAIAIVHVQTLQRGHTQSGNHDLNV